MFGGSRRHRPPSQPLTRETANPNAATAAASAFMRREPPTGNLSSAAAAAALKARPTTPINVADVQSKRALRRSRSVSSNGRSVSSHGGSRDGGSRDLRRTPSNGSMTERTFRSPSPGRSPATPKQHEVPPVPSIPHGGAPRANPAALSHRHSMPLQTQPFRTASQKQKGGQQGSWFGAAATSRDPTANVRKSDLILQTSLPPTQPIAHPADDPRPGSISPSINFSYPRGRLDSPSPQAGPLADQTLVYDANSRRMVPRADLLARQQSVRSASEKPVKKKKTDVSRGGTHLSKGTMDRTRGHAVDNLQVAAAAAVSRTQAQPQTQVTAAHDLDFGEQFPESGGSTTQPVVESKPKASRQQELVHSEIAPKAPVKMDLRVNDGATILPHPDSPRAPVMHREPSPSLEDEESESEQEEKAETSVKDFAAGTEKDDDITTKPTAQFAPSPLGSHPVDTAMKVDRPVADAETTPGPTQGHAPTQPAVRRARVDSQSPARSAHFGTTTDQLLVRHEPPPRSLSPRKSALKHSSSVRGASPSDDSSEASWSRQASVVRDDAAQARKKAVRVSFNDDSNVVVGESAEPPETDSPIVPSPQTKKPWHSIMQRYNKKDTSLVDDEETMTPRPALPLFGSVRDKKAKESNNERPLVRPSELGWSSSAPTSQHASEEAGASADSAIGSILARESASKNAANISRAREPLPPVVTSIEGSGYISSDTASSDGDANDRDALDETDVAETTQSTQATEPTLDDVPTTDTIISEPPMSVQAGVEQSAKTAHEPITSQGSTASEVSERPNEVVPTIAVLTPTPQAQPEMENSPGREYFDVPGGFPNEELYNSSEEQAVSSNAAVHSEVAPPAFRPDTTPVSAPLEPPSASPAAHMADIKEEETESEASGIYSDAYEDLSDVDEGGFMSLDAVVDAPVNPAAPASPTLPQDSRHPEATVVALAAQNKLPSSNDKEKMPLQTPDDWDRAKAYWKSLTVDKRRQLEKEALEEAGEDADLDTTPKPKKKAKKRRSIDRPTTTALAGSQPAEAQPSHVKTSLAVTQPNFQPQPAKQKIQSMARETEHSGSKLRKSMRGEQSGQLERAQPAQPTGSMRKTMRANGSAGGSDVGVASKAPAARPVSYHPPSNSNINGKEAARRTLSTDGRPMSSSGVVTGGTAPTLTRKGSDSSISSFRRARTAGGEATGFRRSMRTSVREPEYALEPQKGSGRFSLRSLSPTGSAFRRGSFTSSTPQPLPTTMGGSSRMRQSLRTNSHVGAGSSKMRMPSFGRSSGKKVQPDKRGSRFADSSDDDDVPAYRSSRFAESSDEDDDGRQVNQSREMPRTMRTSKGASSAAAAALGVQPVTHRSDSPDLPDSDDDQVIVQPKQPSVGNGRSALGRSRSGRGSLAANPTPGTVATQGVGERPAQNKRRGSFMSSILRRKKDGGGKISRDLSESAARRDTRLERSTEQLSLIRSNSSGNNVPKQRPSWPLADGVNGNAGTALGTQTVSLVNLNQRPATSSGPEPTHSRGGILKRRSTTQGSPTAFEASPPVPPLPSIEGGPTESSVTADTPKKKKFGSLRKMFGLND